MILRPYEGGTIAERAHLTRELAAIGWTVTAIEPSLMFPSASVIKLEAKALYAEIHVSASAIAANLVGTSLEILKPFQDEHPGCSCSIGLGITSCHLIAGVDRTIPLLSGLTDISDNITPEFAGEMFAGAIGGDDFPPLDSQ